MSDSKTLAEFKKAISAIGHMIPKRQLAFIREMADSEELGHFVERLQNLERLVRETPAMYATDGEGRKAIAYLHYFHGGSDWWIKELDSNGENAFGMVVLNGGDAELGYISIEELTSVNVEIDLYWEPTTLEFALFNQS